MEVKPGYKQTEVGVIPEDWEVTTARGLASSARNAIVGGPFGSDLVSNDYVDDGVPVIRGQNMSGQWVSGNFVFVTPAKARSLDANLASPGDIVFTQRGTLGQVSLVPRRPFESYLVSQSQMKLSVNREVADPLFYYYVFTSETQQELIRLGTIQTGVPHINLGILRDMPVYLPPCHEQRAIAGALSDADALIESVEQLIAKKRDIKQGAMQQLLTGKQRLPGFTGAWEEKRLGDVASFHKGKGLAKSDLDPYGSEQCIHYGELFTKYPESISLILSSTNSTTDVFRSVANDVLMPTSDVTPTGLATASCIRQDNVVLGGDILVIRADPDDLDGRFLSYVIRQSRYQVLQLVTGTTVFHLYGSDMNRFVFSLPTVKEQRAIVKILDDMDAGIAALETKLEKARLIKQGMMQELLTGRIRLV